MSSVLTRPCSFVTCAWGGPALLKPVGDATMKEQVFQAEVLQGFAGLRSGQRVQVSVDLFAQTGGMLRITSPTNPDPIVFPAQVLLGLPATDHTAALMQKLLSSKLPQS